MTRYLPQITFADIEMIITKIGIYLSLEAEQDLTLKEGVVLLLIFHVSSIKRIFMVFAKE